jgi:hypothetical protein
MSDDCTDRESMSPQAKRDVRGQLWHGISDEAADSLVDYLRNNDIKEEDPILSINCLAHLDTVGTVISCSLSKPSLFWYSSPH